MIAGDKPPGNWSPLAVVVVVVVLIFILFAMAGGGDYGL
jgi:hypothetical protein